MDFNQEQTTAWIKSIQEGNEEAFRQFYEEWYPKAFYVALAITHHEADAKDAAQETMIEIHRSIHKLRDVNYFKLWFNRIVLSKCNRIFRKQKAVTMDMEQKESLLAKEEERNDFLPLNHIRRISDVEVLEQLLKKLSPIYSEVLVYMYYEQCSIKEIADILQIPEGTVKSRLNSAKLKLKEEIQAYERENHIKLDFHEEGIVALLPLVYAAMKDKYKLPLIPFKPKHSVSFQSMATSKVMIASLCTVIGVSGFGIVSQLHKSDQASSMDNTETVQIVYEQPIQFKDISVQSDKEAYFVLMKYAHCEYERKQLSENENRTADALIQALEEHNSEYYSLWLKRK